MRKLPCGHSSTFLETDGSCLVCSGKAFRWGIRKTEVENIKVVGRLDKPALFYWSEFGPSELDESEFTPIETQAEGVTNES